MGYEVYNCKPRCRVNTSNNQNSRFLKPHYSCLIWMPRTSPGQDNKAGVSNVQEFRTNCHLHSLWSHPNRPDSISSWRSWSLPFVVFVLALSMPSLCDNYDVLLELINDTQDPATIQLLHDYGRNSSSIVFLDVSESVTLTLESGLTYRYAVKVRTRVASITCASPRLTLSPSS